MKKTAESGCPKLVDVLLCKTEEIRMTASSSNAVRGINIRENWSQIHENRKLMGTGDYNHSKFQF